MRYAYQKPAKQSNKINTKNEAGLSNAIPNGMMGQGSFKVVLFSAAKCSTILTGEVLVPLSILSSFYTSTLLHSNRSGLMKMWCDCQYCRKGDLHWWGTEQSRKSCSAIPTTGISCLSSMLAFCTNQLNGDNICRNCSALNCGTQGDVSKW